MLSTAAEPPAVMSSPTLTPVPPAKATAPADPGVEVSGIVVSPPTVAAPPAWSTRLNLDPRGLYQPSRTPYLRARPIDSCKPMAGGAQPGAYGKTGFAAGLVCVKRF